MGKTILFIVLILIGLGLVVYGVKKITSESIVESILDLFLLFTHSAVFVILFGLFLIFLGIMKLVHGPNWGIQ